MDLGPNLFVRVGHARIYLGWAGPYVKYLILLGLRIRQTLPTLDILGWEHLAKDMPAWTRPN
jgi:hypothetical protein